MREILLLCSAAVVCHAFVSPVRHGAAPNVKMSTLAPEERWENFKASRAAVQEFTAEGSVESALALCRVAAKTKDADPDAVCDALLTVEKSARTTAKSDGGALSRETLASLDGAWRLVFTTDCRGILQ